MPSIAPTTLFVAGSISITLSPAAFVWTIRTVTAPSAAGTASASAVANILAFITRHSKLCGHVADIDSLAAGAGAPEAVHARFRRLQDEDPAALHRKAAGARALLDVPLDGHRVPAA